MSYFNYFKANNQFMPQHFRFRGGNSMMQGGRNVSITENVNIQQGPSGFWGFMAGLGQGLFGGGMGCGMGMGSIFGCPSMPMMGGFGMGMPMMGGMGMMGMSPFGMFNGAVIPQGGSTGQSGDKYLTSLTQALGSKGTFTKHPDKDGIYIMTTRDGKVFEGTYDYFLNQFKADEIKKDSAEYEKGNEVASELEQKDETDNVKGQTADKSVKDASSTTKKSGGAHADYSANINARFEEIDRNRRKAIQRIMRETGKSFKEAEHEYMVRSIMKGDKVSRAEAEKRATKSEKFYESKNNAEIYAHNEKWDPYIKVKAKDGNTYSISYRDAVRYYYNSFQYGFSRSGDGREFTKEELDNALKVIENKYNINRNEFYNKSKCSRCGVNHAHFD